jgi:GTPase SAR1 family protein
MEKNNIFSMSQSYFTQCVGVILVYKKGDLSTLFALDQWVQRAMESQWSSSIVFSLWCNDMGSYSSDEITPEHREQLIAKWKIPPELVFDINASDDDGRNVMQIYRQVVAAIRQKVVGDRTSASSHLSERVSTPDADERIALSADSSEHSQHTANQRRCLGKC